MIKLSDLPNIGKTMEKRLAAVGINDVETLMKIGSKEAFIKLRLHEGDTCFSSLWAEGAFKVSDAMSYTKEDLKIVLIQLAD